MPGRDGGAPGPPRRRPLPGCGAPGPPLASSPGGRARAPRRARLGDDNGPTDGTADVAAAHGARILTESRRGKGFAMRAAFRRADAYVYVMVDGDDTYPADG